MRLLGFSAALLVAVFCIANAQEQLYVDPATKTGPIGNNYTFTCKAKVDTGSVPSLIWRKGDSPETQIDITNTPGEFVVVFFQNEAELSAESMLTILNAEIMDSGTYHCVHEQETLGSFKGVLDVYKPLAPKIEGDPVLKEGEDITFTCTVEGGSTGTTVWKKGDKILENGREDLNNDGVDDVEVKANNTLVIIAATMEDAGIYSCVHTAGGRDFETNVTVGEEMELTGPKSVKYTEGERARFECTATGSPKPTFSWRKENGTIDTDTRFTEEPIKEKGAHYISQLVLIGVEMNDRGNYICTADNGISVKEHTILLRVRDRLAALWPFIGIMTEVIILIAIIFIHEKCTQGSDVGEEDDDDEALEPIKGAPDEKATSDGEGDVRMRASKE